MRIGGLASGMDIDQIVGDLMRAERIPLDKLTQQKQSLEWQRDDYRSMNALLFDLDKAAFDMKLQSTYNSKTVASTNESAISATATPAASNGSYKIQVDQLASAAVNISENVVSADSTDKIDPNATLESQRNKFSGTVDFSDFEIVTYDKEGNRNVHKFQIDETTESLNDILKKISDSDAGVKAFYDSTADKVVLERTETGNLNTNDTDFLGAEIGYDGTSATFLAKTLQVTAGKQNADGTWEARELGGENAIFTYNDVLTTESTTNQYTLNGITFNFHQTTAANETITVGNDTEASFDKIVAFIDKYNETIEKINDKLNEERYRDFPPLTDEQREDLSEKEIELWEEKAKSGMLRNDSILSGGLTAMRTNLYSRLETTDSYTHLSEIGITTSSSYLDRGKLIINESELKEALANDPDAVYNLFASDGEGDAKGLARRISDTIDNTMERIEGKAGNELKTNEQFSLGRRLDDVDDEIISFEDRLIQIEDRYWRQFTEMEKAIQRMNQQSMYLMQQFGGGM
jgi:flagellar hook-associated protein 2